VTELTLPDGRRLAYATMGDPAGHAIVVVHGTPGSARQLACLSAAARDRGLALIAPDRAGYGGSSYHRARTVASSARDVGFLIQRAGLDGCAVVGLSGGGPTALACGVLLAGRVSAVATVGGVAPMVPRDPSVPAERLLIRVASRSQTATRLLFAGLLRAGRRSPQKALDRFAHLLAEPDARLLRADAAVRAAFLDDLRHPSRSAARAAARDFWLFARAWDVDLGRMAVPLHVWHGDRDRNVPVAHARAIAARCPGAHVHIVEGGGHMPFSHLDQILASVTGPGKEPA
jgi:pimeloyl-ACP methyl ester carboxylesterase